MDMFLIQKMSTKVINHHLVDMFYIKNVSTKGFFIGFVDTL